MITSGLFQCHCCQSEQATILGSLGLVVWVRCRACGLDQTADVDVVPDADWSDD